MPSSVANILFCQCLGSCGWKSGIPTDAIFGVSWGTFMVAGTGVSLSAKAGTAVCTEAEPERRGLCLQLHMVCAGVVLQRLGSLFSRLIEREKRLMHKKPHANPYFAFRFLMIVPGINEALDAAQIYHDPFLRGMWIGRGHMVDRKPLPAILTEQTKLDVYLLTRGNRNVRKITVEYEGIEWFPIDADATDSSVAFEWVLLKDAKYTGWDDIEFKDLAGDMQDKLRVGPDYTREV